jgi:hypothetical protein
MSVKAEMTTLRRTARAVGIPVAEIARRARLSRQFIYFVFDGRRRPTKELRELIEQMIVERSAGVRHAARRFTARRKAA